MHRHLSQSHQHCTPNAAHPIFVREMCGYNDDDDDDGGGGGGGGGGDERWIFQQIVEWNGFVVSFAFDVAAASIVIHSYQIILPRSKA